MSFNLHYVNRLPSRHQSGSAAGMKKVITFTSRIFEQITLNLTAVIIRSVTTTDIEKHGNVKLCFSTLMKFNQILFNAHFCYITQFFVLKNVPKMPKESLTSAVGIRRVLESHAIYKIWWGPAKCLHFSHKLQNIGDE